tara:strand:- start:1109 stop:1804 length:696 start_codon:yes stop_codon:yes gene_type:complete
MFAYIPARSGSKRLPNKNIYPLNGIPLIQKVIYELKKLSFISNIYVSTDSNKIKKISEETGAICLDLRKKSLANDKAGFPDLIKHDLPRFIEHSNGDSKVLFTLATAALVTSSIYKKAHKKFSKFKPEILMSCEPYHSPIWWALKKEKNGFLSPIFKKKIKINSQFLKDTYTDSGLFYFFDQKILKKYSSHKDVKKLLSFEVPFEHRCDLNNKEDLERLKWKYSRLKKKVN